MMTVRRKEEYVETQGISFLEFSGPNPHLLESLFDQMLFQKIGLQSDKNISVYAQGNIRFISNPSCGGNAESFRNVHGRGVCAIGLRVLNSRQAFELAISLGAEPVSLTDYEIPAIQGVGSSLIYLVDAQHEAQLFKSLNSCQFNTYSCAGGLVEIDHLTHNLNPGGIEIWRKFYETIFGFHKKQTFTISGRKTSLHSDVVVSPSGQIKIPLNESPDPKSQINEFIDQFNGEGIQHIALSCADIYSSVRKLSANGIVFQDTVDSYYDLVHERLPGHGEPLCDLRNLKILIDGDPARSGTLLQIFTKESIGPVFFEYIQRKGNNGFGNGNFQMLFESIELDQQRRGVL